MSETKAATLVLAVPRGSERRGRCGVSPRCHASWWLRFALLISWLALPAGLHAATISGTVKDPSGAVIAEAHIQITGGDLHQPVELTSDGLGKFASTDLKPGKYVVRVARDGFEALEKTFDLHEEPIDLQLTLAIARQQTKVVVPGQALAFANSDPVYRQLRGIGFGETFRFDNFTLNYDVATFHFQKGTLTWLRPVVGVVTGAIFVGEGHFHLEAVSKLDAHEISRRTGAEEVDEDFTDIVFRFTPDERMKLFPGLGDRVEPLAEAGAAFEHWKERVRRRSEYPLGFSEYILHGETMDNVDADVLAAIYNRAHPPFFNAYIRGKKHKDLRFFRENSGGSAASAGFAGGSRAH